MLKPKPTKPFVTVVDTHKNVHIHCPSSGKHWIINGLKISDFNYLLSPFVTGRGCTCHKSHAVHEVPFSILNHKRWSDRHLVKGHSNT